MTDHKSKTFNRQPSKLAHWLDDRFTIPGTKIRFGLDPLISLIPGAGDWLAGLLSSYFIVLGARAGVAPSVLLRMGFNILLDILVGSVPLLGDIFDFSWKANTRNAQLMERYQQDDASTEKQSTWLLWLVAIFLLLIIIGALVLLSWVIIKIAEVIL